MLHFSEHAAYLRIEAARAARRFPGVLNRLADGSLHLTAVSLLAPHLTDANHLEVLQAAEHKSKREVEQLVARLRPQPDAAAVVRRLPTPQPKVNPPKSMLIEEPPAVAPTLTTAVVAAPPARPPEIKPLAPERFKVQFTITRETHDKLRQLRDLLRHVIPGGDPAAIFDRALTLLLAELTRTKFAATDRPRSAPSVTSSSRHVPAAVKRNVWQRDGGRCACWGERGRCEETGFLEFHHVVPYARGGPTTTENLELRCRTHHAYEAEQQLGRATRAVVGSRITRQIWRDITRSGPSGAGGPVLLF